MSAAGGCPSCGQQVPDLDELDEVEARGGGHRLACPSCGAAAFAADWQDAADGEDEPW